MYKLIHYDERSDGSAKLFQYFKASNEISLISKTLLAGLDLLNYFTLVKT